MRQLIVCYNDVQAIKRGEDIDPVEIRYNYGDRFARGDVRCFLALPL